MPLFSAIHDGGTVEVAYVGRRALHQQRERNLNRLPLGTIQANPGVNRIT